MSVAVERAVKEVTRASKKSAVSVVRDGIIFQTITAREKNPYKTEIELGFMETKNGK